MLLAGASISDLPLTAWLGDLAHVAYFIVLPILLMFGVGFLIQRLLGLDLPTLTRLNFYLVVPAMVYFAVVSASLSLAEIGTMVGLSLALMVVSAALTLTVAKLRGVPANRWRALVMTSIFYNSGNYGLPLQNLAFRDVGRATAAESLQVFVMLTQNFTSFTLGVMLAAGHVRDGQWKRNLLHVARFPPLYALAAALTTIGVRTWLGEHAPTVASALRPFWDTIVYAKNGFVVVALATLGAQLAVIRPGGRDYPVTLSVALRLLAGPLLMFGLLKLFGVEGLVAQVLLISAAVPTSVNCTLLCMQFHNHPDFVARSVFYSTLLSPVTVTLVILLSRGGLF